MAILNTVDPKDPGAAVFYSFDLAGLLNTGATVSTATWTTALTVANPSTTDTTAVAKLSGGVDGQDYIVQLTVTTSDGETHIVAGVLSVRQAVRQAVTH